MYPERRREEEGEKERERALYKAIQNCINKTIWKHSEIIGDKVYLHNSLRLIRQQDIQLSSEERANTNSSFP